MDLFLVITILVVVSAIYSFLNARYIRLPGSIGIVTIATIVSVIAIVTDSFIRRSPNILLRSLTGSTSPQQY